MEQNAQVYLVGAGPGDPGLMTVRGRELVEQADVLVYDRLVSPRIIAWARPDCERVYVGKTPERHTLPQHEINALLVEKAAPGRTVVRLKGGDPFVFGRGGEEAEELRAHGIPFAVVPGVTSCIAAPAYAGIPVTHRSAASSFTVVTGHEDPAKLSSSLDWEQLAHVGGTLVFLMGMKNLPIIAESLMAYGMADDTPVAVVERGTWPGQRVLTGTLETIAADVLERGFANPSVIVVGSVVALRDELAWFNPRPLAGKTVGITRARHQVSELRSELEELGATVAEFPVSRLTEPSDPAPLAAFVAEPTPVDWVVFTSANGVKTFFRAFEAARSPNAAAASSSAPSTPSVPPAADAGADASLTLPDAAFAGATVVAVGPATAKALAERGVRSVLTPDTFRAEGVADLLRGRLDPHERVLLVRAEDARTVVADMVRERGAELVDVPAYRTVLREDGKKALQDALRAGSLDALTFASSSAVRNTLALLDGDAGLLADVPLFSIGPLTTATMEELGLAPAGEASSSTIGGLVGAVLGSLGGLS